MDSDAALEVVDDIIDGIGYLFPVVPTVVVALPIVVVVAAGKATAFLLLFIYPALHHIT